MSHTFTLVTAEIKDTFNEVTSCLRLFYHYYCYIQAPIERMSRQVVVLLALIVAVASAFKPQLSSRARATRVYEDFKLNEDAFVGPKTTDPAIFSEKQLREHELSSLNYSCSSHSCCDLIASLPYIR